MSPWRGVGPGAVEGAAGKGGQRSLCHCGCLQRHHASGAGAFVGKNTQKNPKQNQKPKHLPPVQTKLTKKPPNFFLIFLLSFFFLSYFSSFIFLFFTLLFHHSVFFSSSFLFSAFSSSLFLCPFFSFFFPPFAPELPVPPAPCKDG